MAGWRFPDQDEYSAMKSMLENTPVVPVVVIEDAITAITAEVPGAHVGAGTVLSSKHAKTIVAAGAKFIVSCDGRSKDVARVDLRSPTESRSGDSEATLPGALKKGR